MIAPTTKRAGHLQAISTTSDGDRTGGRIRGLDTARALAIFGMFWTHVGPMDFEGVAGRIFALPHGRASLLFAVLAGVSLEIIYRRSNRDERLFRRKIMWRSGWLIIGGLALQLLDHGLAVILQYYGVVFLCCAFFVRLSNRRILFLSTLFMVVGGALWLGGTIYFPGAFERASADLLDPPWQTGINLALTGAYPAIVWMCPVLFGVWIGRQDLRRKHFADDLMKRGAAVFAITLLASKALEITLNYPPLSGLYRLIYIGAHSQLPLWMINGLSLASFVLGLSIRLTDRFERLSFPLQAAGRLALTLYVTQILVFARWGDSIRAQTLAQGASHSAILILAALVLATVMLRFLRRGPLEWLISPSWTSRRR